MLETHGTGTKLGDPVETAAVAAVFGNREAAVSTASVTSATNMPTTTTTAPPPLYLTGVKANVGHLEAGAGMAGLFSAMLALQHATAPANALLCVLNEKVKASLGDASIEAIQQNTQLVRWQGRPLVAGVSSFGYSGTIAHVLLQEAPAWAVQRRIESVVASNALGVTGTVAATAAVDRVDGKTASGDTASSTDEEQSSTVADEDDESDEDEDETQSDGTSVWQFAGQGDLKIGAGRELYDTEDAFRSAMHQCDVIVRPYLGGYGISDLLYPTSAAAIASTAANASTAETLARSSNIATATATRPTLTAKQAEELLTQTMYSQPALVALEHCLAALWLSQGMRPDILLGHSLGELILLLSAVNDRMR